MEHKTVSNFFRRISIAIFFIVIFVPAVWMLSTERAHFSFTEKRLLADFPPVPENRNEVQTFSSDIDEYLHDHFGFRDWFIYRYHREIRKRFDITGKGTYVYKGIDDWYFLAVDNLLQDFFGQHLLSEDELNQWITSYREKQQWLKEKGIHYLLIVPPNKQSVYPEFVMETSKRPQGLSRFMNLKNAFADSDTSVLVDLSQTLINNKNTDVLYYKSDTHWTPYGAYLAYLTIAEKIESMLPGISMKKDFSFTPKITRTCQSKTSTCGDLTTMLLEHDSFEESYRDLEGSSLCAKPAPFNYQFSSLSDNPKTESFAKSCKNAEYTALVFRDSFFTFLEPYFSENFSRVIYLWKYYDQENLEELLRIFKPDIVIEEKPERMLFYD